MQHNQTITITRGNIGQAGSIIGAIGLLIGIIGLIWQAGLSVFVAAALVIGLGGILVWAVMTPEDFRGFITGRQMRQSTGAIFSTLLVIGIAALTYVFLARSVITVDMTQSGRFTLSPETYGLIEQLRTSGERIQITGFYSPQRVREREVDDQFFRPYEEASAGLISRVYIDPEQEPLRAQIFVEGFGVVADGTVFASYLTADGRIDLLRTTVVFTPEGRSANQERDLTNALNRLLVRGAYNVYFNVGHGELNAFSTEAIGLSTLVNGLLSNGIEVNLINLAEIAATGGVTPANASVIVMARPTTDLTIPEIELLNAYLNGGGSLLIMTDTTFGSDTPFMAQNGPFNQFLWQSYGIRALDGVVIDPLANVGGNPLDVVGYAFSGSNDIGARLNPDTTPTLFRIPRALQVAQSPVNNGWVILTSDQSYAKLDLAALAADNNIAFNPQTDVAGAQALVAWAWNIDTDGRLLVIGDADFATNDFIDAAAGNRILIYDGLVWLMDIQQQVGFQPQFYATGQPLIFVDGARLDLIAFLTAVLLPGAVLISGAWVWWRRSRA